MAIVYQIAANEDLWAPLTKTVDIRKLQAKDFARWLRKQVRLNGRRSIVGYIGDHIGTPLEMWLQDVTGAEYIAISTGDGTEYQGKQYYLSLEFDGLSMSLEGDTDELPACGYRTVTAWEMLSILNDHLGTHLNASLFSQEEEALLVAA